MDRPTSNEDNEARDAAVSEVLECLKERVIATEVDAAVSEVLERLKQRVGVMVEEDDV